LGSVLKSLRWTRRSVYPLFQHPAEVLAADRGDDPLPEEVRAQLGQAPASERQPQGRWRAIGQAPDGGDLLLGQARGGSQLAGATQRRKAVPREGAEIGRDGVAMDLEDWGDGGGSPVRGVEQKGFGTSPLPGFQRLFQPLMELVEFVRVGLPNGQGA